MSYTKREFVLTAFEEIGLGANYDLQPEQLQTALKRLDAMMATWNKRGIRIGYPLVSSPENSSLDTETNVPDEANETIYTNLAVRLCKPFGVMLTADLNDRANDLFKNLMTSNFELEEVDLDTLPIGAGNNYWGLQNQKFINQASNTDIAVGNDGKLDI
jgi:hypothetical protein